MVLAVVDVGDNGFERFFVVNIFVPAALGPPVLLWGELFIQATGAPGFELFTRDVDFIVGGSGCGVDVVGTAVDGVEEPASVSAVVDDGFFDELALRRGESDGL